MAPGRNWNEASLSENPAIAQLQRLGWTYVPVETLDAERESLKRVVLVPRLEAALRRLNPWMSDDNVHKAVRAITGRQATSLIEANKKQYEDLTYGIALEQDLGDGKKSHPVRFVDYENASANELVVTNQFRVHGTVACSAAANTVCAACTVCAAGTFQGAACTATADTVCTRCDATCTTCTGPRPADCNACLPGSYKAATGCLSFSKCMAGTTQTAACGPAADTVCAACPPGTDSDGTGPCMPVAADGGTPDASRPDSGPGSVDAATPGTADAAPGSVDAAAPGTADAATPSTDGPQAEPPPGDGCSTGGRAPASPFTAAALALAFTFALGRRRARRGAAVVAPR